MALNRVRIAKDKADFVKSLTESGGTTGPFQTYADVVVFAAMFGFKRKKRVAVETVAKREPSPISMEVFISRGYDLAINLLTLSETKDTTCLSHFNPESEPKKTKIFEEYANGGLEILQEEFRGAVDYTNHLLLLLISERDRPDSKPEEFDLTRFL